MMMMLGHRSELQLISTPPKPRIRVLMVEDCRLVRVGIRAMLDETEGIEVVGEVDSGESALAMAPVKLPDVVLIDIGLPGMSGIETIEKIKAMELGCRFVILTSHETQDEALAGMAAGASAFCLKNIPSARLAYVITTVHEGAIWLDPSVAPLANRVFTQSNASASLSSTLLKEQLSSRELMILSLLASGKSNNEIAQVLYISVHTAKFYVSNLLEKLHVTDRVQAAVKAVKEGLI
jgi:DNA-binding NarL/FixJ family response regulator